jgi:hypothetical protein
LHPLGVVSILRLQVAGTSWTVTLECEPEPGVSKMANPLEKRSAAPSAVGSCSATDCVHNEDRECHAGEIRVEMGERGAVCATYDPQKPKARP